MADEQYICTGAGDPRCFPVCPHAIPHIHQDSCDRTCSKNPNPACVLHDTEDDVEHVKYICTSAGSPGCTENCEHSIPHYPFDECGMECSVYDGVSCVPCDEQETKDTDAWSPTEAPEKRICPGAGSAAFCDACEHAVPHEYSWDCELECALVDVDGGSECVPSAPEKESNPVPSNDDDDGDPVLRPERGFSDGEIAMLAGTPTTSNDRKPALSADDIATIMETAATTIGGKRILTTDDIEGIVREATLAAHIDMLRYMKHNLDILHSDACGEHDVELDYYKTLFEHDPAI